VFTVRSALPATSELGTPTPKVFSMPTTSSSASIESRPRPFGPKSGRSSAIWSGVVCSIKFLTSISLIRLRRLVSDIKEVRDLVASRDAGQLSQQNLIRSATRESALTASVGSKYGIDNSCFFGLKPDHLCRLV